MAFPIFLDRISGFQDSSEKNPQHLFKGLSTVFSLMFEISCNPRILSNYCERISFSISAIFCLTPMFFGLTSLSN